LIVSGIQINSNDKNNENQKKVLYLLDQALDTRPDIIVLPEYTNYMGPLDNAYSNALSHNSIWHKQLSGFARINKIGLLAGLLLKTNNKKAASTVVYFDTEGVCHSVYEKLHLFDAHLDNNVNIRESDFLAAGTRVGIVSINKVTCGVALCYDLRFPELFRRLAVKNARIIFVPAAFTQTTGEAHWEILIRARAIENQVFIIAINQVGEYYNGNISYGMSMIVDPWGRVLVRAPAYGEDSVPNGIVPVKSPAYRERPGELIISAPLDLSYQDKVRQNLPCLSHRREDLFSF
jgi:predicted amidohydrolase